MPLSIDRQKKNICLSIARPKADAVIALLRQAESVADLFEIRLDAFTSQPDVALFREASDKPLLFTCRPQWEGGMFAGEENERLDILQKAIDDGADIIDLELKAGESMRQALLTSCAASSCRLLLSWHDFSGTPSRQALMTIFQQMYRSGAHLGKIVTTARRFQDVLQVLSLQQEAEEMEFPLVAFCMGEAGRISRLATLELGGFLSYAAPDDGEGTAPGQLRATTLKRLLELLHHEN
jgi:3-dehydroquinate dehydratase-1